MRVSQEGKLTVHSDVGEVLIEESLRNQVVELGAEISDYEGRDLLLVGVLKGAIFFISDLMRELKVPCEIDFMAISSYENRDGLVWRGADPEGPRDQHLRSRRARRRGHHRLGPDALVPAPHARCAEARVARDLRAAPEAGTSRGGGSVRVGFEIPNRFVIGYGLDFAGYTETFRTSASTPSDLIPNGL